MAPNPLRGVTLTHTGMTYGGQVTEVELIRSFPESTYIKLLFSKPVSDWEKLTTFLVNRKLISFAVAENYGGDNVSFTEPVRSPEMLELIRKKKEKTKAAHEARVKAQAEASAAKKSRVAAAHLKRVEEQKAAAAARKLRAAKHEAERVAAAKTRKARAVAATRVQDLRKAADVKIWLEASLDAQAANAKDSHSTRLALQSLPPVLFSKQDVRPVRPLVKLAKANGVESEVEVSDIQNFDLLQELIRSADRHLSYLFHEADTDGWKLVSRQRAVGRKSYRGAANVGGSA